MERITRKLIGKIIPHMFIGMNLEEVLNERDCEEFDSQWIHAYNAVEELKSRKGYSTENKEESGKIREQAYKAVHDLIGDEEIAGYISDDFGLIADSEILGYKDEFLGKLITCYENSVIPCGKGFFK